MAYAASRLLPDRCKAGPRLAVVFQDFVVSGHYPFPLCCMKLCRYVYLYPEPVSCQPESVVRPVYGFAGCFLPIEIDIEIEPDSDIDFEKDRKPLEKYFWMSRIGTL